MSTPHCTNAHGQPVGEALSHWQGAQYPAPVTLTGRFCRLEALDIATHSTDLYTAFTHNADHSLWTYLPYGPFENAEAYTAWLSQTLAKPDSLFYAIIDVKSNKAIGVAAYLRINANSGVLEIGHVAFSPLLQRTPIATEALFFMLKQAFTTWGYRRCEWKCDALNAASRRAAQRLGFQFEGIFRQATVYKNRNRDTAWFAIIDKDWAVLQSAFVAWLASENFDKKGIQRQRLQAFRS